MTTRVALIAIIVEEGSSTEELNRMLHDAGRYIIGRMGIPYRAKGVNIISVAIDAPQDVISSLAGRIGRLTGITAKTVYSNVVSGDDEPEGGKGKDAATHI
ncbi:MAG: iron-only hydrogenase system regulator [Clostridiales bacterium]|nr:iron-only hydrogenase system regulator [Clostridiales bacterium]